MQHQMALAWGPSFVVGQACAHGCFNAGLPIADARQGPHLRGPSVLQLSENQAWEARYLVTVIGCDHA